MQTHTYYFSTNLQSHYPAGQGNDPAWGTRSHRRKLRADPPFEPRRDGRAPAPIRRWRGCQYARPRRQRDVCHLRRGEH